MLTKVKAWIDRHHMLVQGDKVVVACSGGPDSLALLHIFHGFCLEYNISVYAAHVDHMFRGAESAREAAFVVEFCQLRDIPCFHTAIDVPNFIQRTGISTQDAARIVRYRYLRSVAEKLGGAKIATGHHRDDQAETVLIHILRGAGSTGIRGIQPVNEDIIHPLLSVSREEIAAYCAEHQLTPQTDSSNLKPTYLRNRIRMNLLPELEKRYNANIKDALCRTAEIVGDEHDFIQSTARSIWNQAITVRQDGSIFIAAEPLRSVHVAVKREIFRMVIEKKQGCLTGISFHHIEMLLKLFSEGRVGSIAQLPNELMAYKRYDGLQLDAGITALSSSYNHPEQELAIPGITSVPELGIIITAEVMDKLDTVSQPNVAVFDWLALSPPLFVRTRLSGDRFQPLGFKGSKKLKDFFIDEKVPREMRDYIPVICDRTNILWVGGYRQAETGKINEKTKKFLKLIISKI